MHRPSPISASSGRRSPRPWPASRKSSSTTSRAGAGTWSCRASRWSGCCRSCARRPAGTGELSIVRRSIRQKPFPSSYSRKSPAHETLLALADHRVAIAAVCWRRRSASLVVVDETEFAVVTSFGRIAAVYGDAAVARRGCMARHPGSSRSRSTARFRVFDPPPREVITGDKRNLEVAPYVVWRVADPVLFLRASGSHELAEARLNERVSASLSDAIGRRDLAALASTDAERGPSTTLTREVLTAVAPAAPRRAGRRGPGRPAAAVQSSRSRSARRSSN